MRRSTKSSWIVLLLFIVVFASDGLTQQAGQSVGAGGAGGLGQGQTQRQNQDPSYRPPTQPAIRVTSKMVQLSVIVHDKDGNPVSGLKKDDFKLYDQGQSQKIAFFSEQANILHTKAIAIGDSPKTEHAFSNRNEEDNSDAGAVTAILLDKLNTWA